MRSVRLNAQPAAARRRNDQTPNPKTGNRKWGLMVQDRIELSRPGALLYLLRVQMELFADVSATAKQRANAGLRGDLPAQLLRFNEFGTDTQVLETEFAGAGGAKRRVATYVNEFWTAKQRAAHSLHEISYRACFKPQLPRFFIERLTSPGDTVYDPFMGRGTTPLEAALLGRVPIANDINPLSALLLKPRLNPPRIEQVAERLGNIPFGDAEETPEDLLVFYHPETLREISALKQYFGRRRAAVSNGAMDNVDSWIEMVALNRLTGHSPGFFSVYTLPPNQAASVKAQRKINADRNQKPEYRNVAAIILKKSRSLLKDLDEAAAGRLRAGAESGLFVTSPAGATPQITGGSVALAVTSPPFLNVVDYAGDNWLRCWFAGIDPGAVRITVPKKLEAWEEVMTGVLRELRRVLKPGGHVAFEVGEVSKGTVRLEESVLRCGSAVGLEPLLVLINQQDFTKTANCWGVDNNAKGTNTNRIVLFKKGE